MSERPQVTWFTLKQSDSDRSINSGEIAGQLQPKNSANNVPKQALGYTVTLMICSVLLCNAF